MLRAINIIVFTVLHGGIRFMKNFKLTLCDALIERLVNLASLEENAQFQGVYLDTLHKEVRVRDQLRRSSAEYSAHSSVRRASGCCVRNT